MDFSIDLKGKTALVTGSSRGIGRATGLLLASLGVRVIFHGTKESPQLLSAVEQAGNKAEKITADFGNMEEVKGFIRELEERNLVPDILILNASVQSYTGLENFSEEEFSRMYRTNVESSFLLIQAFAPYMRKKNWGRIIFVGSINGAKPASRLALYGSTKAALMNVAKTAAMENAPFQITVNTILPGVITTDRNAAVLSDAAFAENLKEKIPMRRFGNAEECAFLISFLASENASYITGAEIPIAGGLQL
ncbi:MAG: SDR family oxidoreductase [Lentisphaeria bacterium]|nr:SDR family oxidoreductase [Lentisphaeria bacterium]